MIQRIQTLFLLMTTVLPLLFLKLKFIAFTDNDGISYFMRLNGLFSSAYDQPVTLIRQILPVSIPVLMIPLLSLISVFLFRKRKLQMNFALLLILLSAVSVITLTIYSFLTIREFHAKIVPGFMMIVPLLLLIFSILAFRSIKKDEDLVRSYDRLR